MAINPSAALTTARRKLKDLAADAVSIPSTQELYARKKQELRDAHRKLSTIVERQIAIEKNTSRRTGDTTAVLTEKAATLDLIERLSSEAGVLNAQIQAAKPKPPLTPQQQVRYDMVVWPPAQAPWKTGSSEQIAQARRELDEIVRQRRQACFDGGSSRAEAKFMPAYKEAALKLHVLEGHFPSYMPYETRADVTAAIETWGRK